MSENNKKESEEFLLEQDRLNCIGCGACVAVSPSQWEVSEDGKVSIIGGKVRKDGWEEKKITSEELEENMEAAESCPVTVIHITSMKDKKRLI